MGPVESSLFGVFTVIAALASLHAWREQQAYGAFRFLAFECLALLIVWNLRRWFQHPLSARQIVSWIVLAASTALAAHGLHLLRVVGRAQARIMEDTQVVVRVGAYRHIRHPLYASLLFFGWGVFLKGCDPVSGGLALGATACWAATARYEERFNAARFGSAYSDYMKRTKMFVPFLV